MNYKVYLYVFFTFLSIFAFSYLLTNFIYDFITCSKIF